jgi:decaprenyl-phosphate phosphoribosyltransferase
MDQNFSKTPAETVVIPKVNSSLKDYIALARPDHWFKNIFMVPGMLFAILYFDVTWSVELVVNILVGVISTCLVASANYVINEWLDAEFDKFHPVKKARPSVTKNLHAPYIYMEYLFLATLGLALAYYISMPFFLLEVLLLVMGIIYNVRPLRSKDRPFIDVLSESINNPIRLALGWYIFVPSAVFPPLSIIVAYWMGGAFLMGIKRFAEYRFINDAKVAGLYRKSFQFYTENSLLISSVFYALTSTFFLGIFLIKNRIELLISFPFFALLFAWYLKIGLQKDSVAQKPEKLYRQKYFRLFVVFLGVLLVGLLFIDIPALHWFLQNTFNK